MIRSILFDLWETLATKRMFVFENIRAEYNLSEDAFSFYLSLLKSMELGELSEQGFWLRLFSEFEIDRKTPILSLVQIYDEITIINHELLAFAMQLKKNGYKIGILSNTDPAAAAYLEQAKILDHFNAAVFSFDAHLLKPDPKIYAYALGQVDSMPEDTVYIDDNTECIGVADGLGMHGIVFKNTQQVKDSVYRLVQQRRS